MGVTITHGEIVKRRLTREDFKKSTPTCYYCGVQFIVDHNVTIDPYVVTPTKSWEEPVLMQDIYHDLCYDTAEAEYKLLNTTGRPKRRRVR